MLEMANHDSASTLGAEPRVPASRLVPPERRTTAWLVERWRKGALERWRKGALERWQPGESWKAKGRGARCHRRVRNRRRWCRRKKKNKMGMGTGLAASALGGLVRVEENLEREDSYDSGGGYGESL